MKTDIDDIFPLDVLPVPDPWIPPPVGSYVILLAEGPRLAHWLVMGTSEESIVVALSGSSIRRLYPKEEALGIWRRIGKIKKERQTSDGDQS